MYVAAWPLVREYPGNRFQTGLFGTWMHAQRKEPKPERQLYSDIEGGLGWWRDTRFATETPKFIMGGVALNFVAWANGPGAGKGRNWRVPSGKYGVAQLSPWILWPPDGLNLKQGTCGELFGYGYLPLPLTRAKTVTAGRKVPTGNNCWTLFLNSANFKGPVAFFTPYFFSSVAVDDPSLAGLFLDTLPSQPKKPMSMETQHIPSVQARDKHGNLYARVAPTSFPRSARGESAVMHQLTVYNKKALWDAVEAWFERGGPAVRGPINADGALLQCVTGKGSSSWRIASPHIPKDQKVPLAWGTFAEPAALDPHTFGFRWNTEFVSATESKGGPLVTIPEYYRLKNAGSEKAEWVVAKPEDVPPETRLSEAHFGRPKRNLLQAYVTPDDPNSCWKKPGPVAGPFHAKPGDGSVVTYFWYRFADQPALLNADLTDAEREDLQKRAEKIHRYWKKNRDYLAAPRTGKLAHIDPAPIVTRQGWDERKTKARKT
jgi:hypothetical protein